MDSDALNDRPEKAPICLLGAFLIAAVAFCDWWTGPDLSLALCYLLPTTMVAWYAGNVAGILTGIGSTFVWLGVELAWHRTYSNAFIPYSNGILQLGVTLFSAVVTSAVSERNRKLKLEIAVRKETEAKLNVLNETLELRVAERSAAAEKRAEELSRSEAALQRQTGILKSILTSMGDGVVVTDDVGYIHLCNPAAARLLNIPDESIEASHWTDQVQVKLPELLARFGLDEHVLLQSLQGESINDLELRTRTADMGQDSWLSMATRPLFDDQHVFQGVVFVFNDITTRKQVDRLVADVSDREQERIGQDLHDGLGQHLVSTAFAVTLLRDKLLEKALPEAEDAREIAELLDNAITQSRNLARGLYPVKLEQEGLCSALEELADNTNRKAGVSCRCYSQPVTVSYDVSVSANLYRLAQEAVNNALKHGHPGHITIRVGQKGSALTLSIINDGKSYEPPAPKDRGMGLHIMKYRARIIGAELSIEAGADGGTIVHCSVPNLKRSTLEHASVR